ncbi:hypothetical protein B484DRAFT_223045 [Ochromonadaceae sp. CCMP2298]|nr:hypothetical protein B484DRAFT_223045 [Ochromonadaceae sp. CCMP2298]
MGTGTGTGAVGAGTDTVHRGVSCDSCGVLPITGPRFKCTTRADFDLCSACEGAAPQPYPMLKIRNPAHHPTMLIYDYGRGGGRGRCGREGGGGGGGGGGGMGGAMRRMFAEPLAHPHSDPQPHSQHLPDPYPTTYPPHTTTPPNPPTHTLTPNSFPTPAYILEGGCRGAGRGGGGGGGGGMGGAMRRMFAEPGPDLIMNTPRPSLRFVRDGCLPDGSVVLAGQTWVVRNDSHKAWPLNASLRFVGGDAMQAECVVCEGLGGGQEGQLQVLLTAPLAAGRYAYIYI